MSLLFIDSFDHYTEITDKWDANNFTGGTGTYCTQTRGRFTPGALQYTGFEDGTGRNSGNANITKILPPSDEVIYGFAFWADATPGANTIVLRDSAGVLIGGITFVGNDIELVSAGSGVVGTATSSMTSLSWQFYEVRVKRHATLGEIELRKGGALVLAVTGLNTGTNSIEQLWLSHVAETDSSYLDDLYVLNTAGTTNNWFLGDTRITTLRPKANGVLNNFTPSEATSWESTDEQLHDRDISYVEAGQMGASEDYTNKSFDDVGIAAGTIFGVQVVNACKKTDAGRLDYKDEMVIAGNRYTTGVDNIAVSGNYKMTTYIRDTDPSDDGTWTEDKVEAVGSGFTITYREV
jgi:hypothetical protein